MPPLAAGCNHVALLTQDLDRLIAFYEEVFDAEVLVDMQEGPLRHALIHLGGGFCLHPFEHEGGNRHAAGAGVAFDRGHLDHVAIDVADADAFERIRVRLVEAGASDGTITDFGVVRGVWFEDPDGMGAEIAVRSDGEPLAFDDRRLQRYVPAAAGA